MSGHQVWNLDLKKIVTIYT